jgi:23S rRNA (uracil1939-C5)-methyltransferase
MSALPVGQTLDVTIERLAFGGHAVARHEGVVVFVPFAAPGDRVRITITESKDNFTRGRIDALLAPGPHRTEPRCRHFGECGGCQFQHVAYAEQVRQKGEFVRDALVRIGRFDWPEPVPVHHAEPWGYRSRTQLKLKATSGPRSDGKDGRLRKRERKEMHATPVELTAGRPVLGFHRATSHSVLDVQECPVLAPELEAGLADLRAAIAQLDKDALPYQIEGAAGIEGAAWSPDLPGMRKDLVVHEIGRFRYVIEPESFFQGNRFLVSELVAGALGDAHGDLAYDLYAGVGLFSLPLADRFTHVVAVEDERRAATLGRVNVRNNGCRNVTYLRSTTEQFLRQELARASRQRPGLVLVDPPRVGAKPAVPALLALGAPQLVYVSCDPQTMARDLRLLVDGGYALATVAAFDMFPHTWHVESVARLALR